MLQQDVCEGDDLQGLAQAHAVGQDAAQATAALKPLQRLHQVVIQEADPSDLDPTREDTVRLRPRYRIWPVDHLRKSARDGRFETRIVRGACWLPGVTWWGLTAWAS